MTINKTPLLEDFPPATYLNPTSPLFSFSASIPDFVGSSVGCRVESCKNCCCMATYIASNVFRAPIPWQARVSYADTAERKLQRTGMKYRNRADNYYCACVCFPISVSFRTRFSKRYPISTNGARTNVGKNLMAIKILS